MATVLSMQTPTSFLSKHGGPASLAPSPATPPTAKATLSSTVMSSLNKSKSQSKLATLSSISPRLSPDPTSKLPKSPATASSPSPSISSSRPAAPRTATNMSTCSNPNITSPSPRAGAHGPADTDARTVFYAAIAPALGICFDLGYSIKYVLTVLASLVLAYGVKASRSFAVNFARSTRLILFNLRRLGVFAAIRLYYLSGHLTAAVLHASHRAAVWSSKNGLVLTGKALLHATAFARYAWKRTERLRDRMFFEFMVWILHPSPLALFLLWPGWVVVFGGFMVYYFCY